MKISSANTSADSLNKRRYNSATTNQQTQNYDKKKQDAAPAGKVLRSTQRDGNDVPYLGGMGNGNYSDFKSYYRSLNMESRRRFIGFIYNQVDGYTFYRMVDMLMFDKH